MMRIAYCVSRAAKRCAFALCSCSIFLLTLTVNGNAVNLTCNIVDSESGEFLAARCKVIDRFGFARFPALTSSYYSNFVKGYFYADGTFTVSLAQGRVLVYSSKGFEFRERIDTFFVTADTSVTVSLSRFIDASRLGWFSGDTHVHIDHSGGTYTLGLDDACLMCRAEGLAIANFLDNQYLFTGGPVACEGGESSILMAEEWRSSSEGHFAFLGIRSLIEPFSSTWWPMACDAIDSCHASGGISICAHPVTTDEFASFESWSGSGLAREIPIVAFRGKLDAFEVMSYSNLLNQGIELDLWYRLLNCGFRVPASAGTDAVMNRRDSAPLGGYRVYVNLGSEEVTFHSWLRTLARGETFVTNGPLITEFSLDGFEPGDSAELESPGKQLHGKVSVRCAHKIDKIEILANGVPRIEIALEPSTCSVDTFFTLDMFESSWVAARVIGGSGGWNTCGSFLFAHTSPIYFNLRSRNVWVKEDAAYFVRWLGYLIFLAAQKGDWPNEEARERFFSECEASRRYFVQLATEVLADAGGYDTVPVSVLSNTPNPFSNVTTIGLDLGDAPEIGASTVEPLCTPSTEVVIFDAAGRVVRRLMMVNADRNLLKVSWDGKDDSGKSLASGVYFARVSIGSNVFSRKLVLVR